MRLVLVIDQANKYYGLLRDIVLYPHYKKEILDDDSLSAKQK